MIGLKRYSIYIGNNVYNIVTQNKPTDSMASIPINNSFSASFRGRNSDNYNTTFFNFKIMQIEIISILTLSLPTTNLFSVKFEYATSLGLNYLLIKWVFKNYAN